MGAERSRKATLGGRWHGAPAGPGGVRAPPREWRGGHVPEAIAITVSGPMTWAPSTRSPTRRFSQSA